MYSLKTDEIDGILEARKKALSYNLSGKELGSEVEVLDKKGLVGKVTDNPDNPLYDEKQQTKLRLDTAPELRKLVIWYLGAAAFWLVFGTSIGQYLGMKFFWPDMESISWLGFGRLRPVHTNTVFWGWTSLAMIGLGYFVIARTSNTRIFS